jgi:TolB-like protein/Tfp pilus assembly protein PilF
MKRCPECRRDYYDDSLIYCLDDGAALLEGPAAGTEPATAIMPPAASVSEAVTTTFEKGAANIATSVSKKNLISAGVIGAVLITVLGIGSYFYYSGDSSGQINSIAVMPFVNDSGNPDNDYLSDGITESLINSLSQIPAMSVKARSSVFSYKGKEISLQQVAKDLSVEAVLTGRVAQRGDQVLMNVELVDVRTGNHIWGDQYVRNGTDVVQLQSEIARDVSSKLRAKLTSAEQQKVAKNYTESPEAYRVYLLGRYHWNKRRPDDLKKSLEHFQQAIDIDPTYALAYAALAEGYVLVPNYGLGSPKEAYPKARAAATKAIEIDPTLAEGHNAMASVLHNYDWKFAEAETEWKKALELNPNYATAHQWYSEYLANMGRSAEALSEMRRAHELDPLSLIINGLLGLTVLQTGDQNGALAQLKRTLEMDPNFPRTHFFLSTVYHSMGRFEEAADEFAKGVTLNGAPPDRIAAMTERVKAAARAGGERGYSRAMAEVLETSAGATGLPAPFLASLWAKAGETDKAFEILEKAFERRDDTLLMIKGPGLEPLRPDPRYKDLVRRIGLPE